jgi:hypothetical protein
VTGREGGLGLLDASAGPPFPERFEDRDRCREQRGLGVLGQVEAIGRTVPGE